MSELFDKQVNAQKEKIFWGSRKLPQVHEKCAMKMKKKQTRKNNTHIKMLAIDGRKHFIGRI